MALGGNKGGMMSEINVTPFVDVMLVLLIIFMVTAPMMTQGEKVTLPEARSEPLPTVENQIIVTVNKEEAISINNEPVKIGFLCDTLKLKLENRVDRDVYLRADRDIPYGNVVQVMSEIKRAGIQKLGMLTMPGKNMDNESQQPSAKQPSEG